MERYYNSESGVRVIDEGTTLSTLLVSTRRVNIGATGRRSSVELHTIRNIQLL